MILPNVSEIENITSEFLSMIKLPVKSAKSLNYLVAIPKLVHDDEIEYAFPIGIASVTSALKASGRIVFTLNMNYVSESETLLPLPNNLQPLLSQRVRACPIPVLKCRQ